MMVGVFAGNEVGDTLAIREGFKVGFFVDASLGALIGEF